MVLNLAPALGLSHSLLSADWDKAMGFYLSGRDQLAVGSWSVLNSGLVPHGYVLLYGASLCLALWLTILILKKARVVVKNVDCGAPRFCFLFINCAVFVASVNPTMCLTTSRAENTEIVHLLGLTPCVGVQSSDEEEDSYPRPKTARKLKNKATWSISSL